MATALNGKRIHFIHSGSTLKARMTLTSLVRIFSYSSYRCPCTIANAFTITNVKSQAFLKNCKTFLRARCSWSAGVHAPRRRLGLAQRDCLPTAQSYDNDGRICARQATAAVREERTGKSVLGFVTPITPPSPFWTLAKGTVWTLLPEALYWA